MDILKLRDTFKEIVPKHAREVDRRVIIRDDTLFTHGVGITLEFQVMFNGGYNDTYGYRITLDRDILESSDVLMDVEIRKALRKMAKGVETDVRP